MSEGAIVFAIWGSVTIAVVVLGGIGLLIYLECRDREE